MTKIVALMALFSLLGLALLERTDQRTDPVFQGRGLEIALDLPGPRLSEGKSWGLRLSLGLPGTPLVVHHVTEVSSPRASRRGLRVLSRSVLAP